MSSAENKNPSIALDWEDETRPSSNDKNTRSYVLQESDMTPGTEGSTSEEDIGWLGGIGADFRNIAISLKNVGGDVANFVQRSALSVAAEIAQLDRDSSDEEGGEENAIQLPWEIRSQESNSVASSYYQENEELKDKIFALSSDRSNFLKPYSTKSSSNLSDEEESKLIVLDEPRIHLIRRLLEIDENLAATHAHLSGRSDVKEIFFWTNYFFNCEKVRREHIEELQSMSLVSTLSSPADETPITTAAEASEDENASQSSQNSLVPADDSSGSQDADVASDNNDDDYVQVNRNGIASPPCSLQSVEDLVLVSKSISVEK